MPTVSPDDPAASGPSSTPGTGPSRYGPPLVRRTIVADALLDPAERQRLGFPGNPLIDLSCSTVKADAARRSYGAGGRGISWAVIDSGIDADQQHFRAHDTLGGDVADLHRDFTLPGRPEGGAALRD